MAEQLIIYLLLAGAVFYLGVKFLVKKKKHGDKDCDNCS